MLRYVVRSISAPAILKSTKSTQRGFCVPSGEAGREATEIAAPAADSKWFLVAGFSRNSSRRDLQMWLGDIQCQATVPALHHETLKFKGHWTVQLAAPQSQLIKERSKEFRGRKIVIHELPKAHDVSSDELPGADCVRISYVPRTIPTEAIYYIFRDCNLLELKKVRHLGHYNNNSQYNHYVARFETEQDASIASQDFNMHSINGQKIHVAHLDC